MRSMAPIRHRVVLVAGALALAALACGRIDLESHWADRPIAVDGNDQEWEGAKYAVQDWPVDIGLMNDGQYLYVCLSTVDRNLQRQVLVSGLELWLDPKGGKKKVAGLRFPGGRLRPTDPSGEPGPEEEAGDPRARRPPRGSGPGWRDGGPLDPAEMAAQMMEMAARSDLLFVGPQGTEERRMGHAEAEPLEVALSYDRGRLVYEARVPLETGALPLGAIRLAPGQRLGLGILTPQRVRPVRGRGEGDMGPGGMEPGAMEPGGMGGPRPGGRRGGRPGGMAGSRGVPEPVEVWARVQLTASAP
ncbi:MAG: hypothetical protein ABIL09_05700 [Gemmatimonadota bacterium]